MRKLLVVAMLSGCGSGPVDDFMLHGGTISFSLPFVEPEFVSHVSKFRDMYVVDVNMLITWKTLDSEVMASCNVWSDGHREIYVDKAKWPTLTPAGQEQLMFHELGHCIFNLHHDENRIDSGPWRQVPRSIMNPYVFGDRPYYAALQQYYYDELGSKR